MKAPAIYLLTVGFFWTLAIALVFVTMSGITEPISLFYTSSYYLALLLGPAMLIIGSVLILRGTHQKFGTIQAAAGCLILTVTVAHESILGLHLRPLQARPPYLVFIVMIIVTVLADAAAWRLYRRAFSAHEQII
jgi:hypothetical protein